MQDYTQLGIAGITLGILYFIVRYFVSALRQKDVVILEAYRKINEISTKFNTTISNHIVHEQKAKEDLSEVLQRLNVTLDEQPKKILDLFDQRYTFKKK